VCACLQTDGETALPGREKRVMETERREKHLTSLRGGKLVYAKTEKRYEEEGERTREKERVVAHTQGVR
jgi:hypothetical protein